MTECNSRGVGTAAMLRIASCIVSAVVAPSPAQAFSSRSACSPAAPGASRQSCTAHRHVNTDMSTRCISRRHVNTLHIAHISNALNVSAVIPQPSDAPVAQQNLVLRLLDELGQVVALRLHLCSDERTRNLSGLAHRAFGTLRFRTGVRIVLATDLGWRS